MISDISSYNSIKDSRALIVGHGVSTPVSPFFIVCKIFLGCCWSWGGGGGDRGVSSDTLLL